MSLSVAQIDLKQKLASLSPAKRALLELKLMKKHGRQKEVVEERISRRTTPGPAPLSHHQQ